MTYIEESSQTTTVQLSKGNTWAHLPPAPRQNSAPMTAPHPLLSTALLLASHTTVSPCLFCKAIWMDAYCTYYVVDFCAVNLVMLI